MMQQREGIYQLDKPILARDASGTATAQGPEMPPGWIRLDQCNLSAIQGQTLVVQHVLLHPEIGVALIDIAPAEAPGAEAAFRDRLESARFAAIFPGQLPVVHLQLEPEVLGSLETLLPEAFAALPPLRLPGGDGWVSVVRRALASRGPLRDAAAAPARGPGLPQMLNREVAAQRAGLTSPPQVALPPEAPPHRWPSLPVLLALAGLTAVAAAAAAFWTSSGPADPRLAATPPSPSSGAAAPERSGAPAAPPGPLATGGGGPVVAPSLVPAARVPEPTTLPPGRERAAAPARPAEPVPPASAGAILPPPAIPGVERMPRLTVRTAANIRSGPNNRAQIIRTAPRGEVLREFSRNAEDWVEVGDTRPQGWMFGKYLVTAKP